MGVGQRPARQECARRKTDTKDSEWLAEWLQRGWLAGSFVPPRWIRDLRNLTRTRAALAQGIFPDCQWDSESAGGCQHPTRQRSERHTGRGRQCLEPFCKTLRRRPQLSLCQRLPLQPQNAVMAPLISQIYSYPSAGFDWGAGACALRGFASVAFSCAGFAPSLSVSFATSSAITSLVFPYTGPLAFTRFEFRSLFF